jgi:organic hydroperoxide reductase OsmC/OhrA
MLPKSETPDYHFKVHLNWEGDHKGMLHADHVTERISVATPPPFEGGIPDMWSPEHLFLSSISSCFMTTFLAIAQKKRITIQHFDCMVTGHITKDDTGHLSFTTINLYPQDTCCKRKRHYSCKRCIDEIV